MLQQIKASAGSGKTYTITKNFLDLLTQANNHTNSLSIIKNSNYPEQIKNTFSHSWTEILAVTFTNKAANEMKERIITELKKTALSYPDTISELSSPEAESKLEVIFKHYNLLNVRTIDSLLNLLVRLHALELNLSPDFSCSFNLKAYFDPFFDSLIEEARENEFLKNMLIACCKSRLLYTEKKHFLAGQRFHEILEKLINYNLKQNPLPQLPSDFEITELLKKNDKDLIITAKELFERINLENLVVNSGFMSKLNELLTNNALNSSSKLFGKDHIDEILTKPSKGQASNAAADCYTLFCQLVQKNINQKTILRQALSLSPFVRLTIYLNEPFKKFFTEQNILPTDLFPVLTKQLLEQDFGPSDAFCRLGTRLAHLLIDEFQDTAKNQWLAIKPLAIECLSKGGKFIYVGDIKQAIYGFRGGDASLFEEILEDSELTCLVEQINSQTLPYNWRSKFNIVKFNNEVFSRLGQENSKENNLSEILVNNFLKDDPKKIITEALKKIKQTFKNAGQQLPPDKAEKTSAGFIYFRKIEAKGKELLEEYIEINLIKLLKDDILKRYPLKDIAILVFKNKEGELISNWLTNNDIPVFTENSLIISEHSLIQQLISFLEFINNPLDNKAFFEFITSPDLFLRVTSLNAELVYETVSQKRTESCLYKELKENKKIKDFNLYWDKWIKPFQNYQLMSAYDLAYEIINYYNLFNEFPEDKSFLLYFLELLQIAKNEKKGSLADFLVWWHEQAKVEKIPLAESIDAIRIMTIHKAKGLEFPVVILPFNHNQFISPQHTDFVAYTLEQKEFMVNMNKELKDVYYDYKTKKLFEALNMLYVAWTRPIEELYIFITNNTISNGPATYTNLVQTLLNDLIPELNLIQNTAKKQINQNNNLTEPESPIFTIGNRSRNTSIQQEQEKNFEQAINEITEEKLKQEFIKKIQTVDYKPMHWLPRLKIRKSFFEEEFMQKHRGILIHRCLEYLVLKQDTQQDINNAIKKGFLNLHLVHELPYLSEEKILSLQNEIQEKMFWLASLPQAKIWFSKDVAINSYIEQEILNDTGAYRIDKLILEKDKITILDYKTGKPNYIPHPEHKKQIYDYTELLQKIYSQKIQGVLIYIDVEQVIHINL